MQLPFFFEFTAYLTIWERGKASRIMLPRYLADLDEVPWTTIAETAEASPGHLALHLFERIGEARKIAETCDGKLPDWLSYRINIIATCGSRIVFQRQSPVLTFDVTAFDGPDSLPALELRRELRLAFAGFDNIQPVSTDTNYGRPASTSEVEPVELIPTPKHDPHDVYDASFVSSQPLACPPGTRHLRKAKGTELPVP